MKLNEILTENKQATNNILLLEALVNSSWILRIDYADEVKSDDGFEYIEFETIHGNVYRYYDIPNMKKLYRRWIRSSSKGKFWWKNFAKRFVAERVF